MKTAKEYRQESREALRGNFGMAILAFIIYGLIVSAGTATFVGGLLLTGALTVGMAFTMMTVIRSKKIELGNLFHGFSSVNFVSTIGLFVKTAIFTFLWSLLLFVPGIIAAYKYSMAPYILADHPDMTGGQAITASKNLMKGKKWKLFCLELSFIGWIILCVLTCGILTFWVAPWMEAAHAAFYESIKDEVQA